MWRLAMIGSPEVLTVGDSSPDSAETSFRDLDHVFLQTQTRIWLGEVLHVRFDEDVGIADLLADGELLFQVSKKVWKMLLNKYGELKHSKVHMYERTSFGKSEGKYTPYPKVDSFLKICQILGLTGIDLFSPTDAVDKRDVRRVCMCIRSLSKKAMVEKLEVPDFDVVRCNVLMPTNLVSGIRRNLELSQYSSSTSNASSPEVLVLEHSQVSDSGFDVAESFIDPEFESPLWGASYDSSHVTDIVEEASHVLSSDNDQTLHENCFKNSIHDRNHYEQLDENLDELYDESIASCYTNTREENTIPSLSFIENDCAWLIQSDDRYYPGQRKCSGDSIDTLISSSFNGSEFECYSSSSLCSTCIVENIEDQESNDSKSNYRDGSEAASDENFSIEKQVVTYTHVTLAEPSNATDAVVDTTVYQKEIIIADELGRNKDKDGRTVRKSGNKVLKSVAGIITVVGALVFLLHVSGQKKGKEKNNETAVPLLVQKQNQEFFTRRNVNTSKSNSPSMKFVLLV